jgi:hypothetical protein
MVSLEEVIFVSLVFSSVRINEIIIIIIIIVYLRAQLNSQQPITKLAQHITQKYTWKYKHGIQNTETCSKNDNNKTK